MMNLIKFRIKLGHPLMEENPERRYGEIKPEEEGKEDGKTILILLYGIREKKNSSKNITLVLFLI